VSTLRFPPAAAGQRVAVTGEAAPARMRQGGAGETWWCECHGWQGYSSHKHQGEQCPLAVSRLGRREGTPKPGGEGSCSTPR
jgi:hypothetical protein